MKLKDTHFKVSAMSEFDTYQEQGIAWNISHFTTVSYTHTLRNQKLCTRVVSAFGKFWRLCVGHRGPCVA